LPHETAFDARPEIKTVVVEEHAARSKPTSWARTPPASPAKPPPAGRCASPTRSSTTWTRTRSKAPHLHADRPARTDPRRVPGRDGEFLGVTEARLTIKDLERQLTAAIERLVRVTPIASSAPAADHARGYGQPPSPCADVALRLRS
jgi:hypothetical protein